MHIVAKNKVVGEPPLAEGALNLRIAGFNRQNLIPIGDIVRAIDVLPGYHLQGLREIVYAPDWTPIQTARWHPGYPRILPMAEFVQRQRRIVFYDLGNHDLFHHVLYHEIGHFVFYLAISSQVKKKWVTEVFPCSECITPYATLNASEDFAETYAGYMRNADTLKQLPEKYAFMRDYVFSGKPETLKERNQG
ncbi:MAG TPA: hypothetical protein VEC06_00740 [Paucimonas sp.]|nr:hypothetical protein [Paucimonas sp.]